MVFSLLVFCFDSPSFICFQASRQEKFCQLSWCIQIHSFIVFPYSIKRDAQYSTTWDCVIFVVFLRGWDHGWHCYLHLPLYLLWCHVGSASTTDACLFHIFCVLWVFPPGLYNCWRLYNVYYIVTIWKMTYSFHDLGHDFILVYIF